MSSQILYRRMISGSRKLHPLSLTWGKQCGCTKGTRVDWEKQTREAKGKEIDPKMTSLPWTEDNGKAITSATTNISRRSWWLRCLALCCCSSRVTCLFFFAFPSGKDARRARSLRNRGQTPFRYFWLVGCLLVGFFWPFPCVIWDEVLRNENLNKKIKKSIWGSTKIRFDVSPKREKTPPSTNQVGPRESLPYIISAIHNTWQKNVIDIRNSQ